MFKTVLILLGLPISMIIIDQFCLQDPEFKPFSKSHPQTKLSKSVSKTLDSLGNSEERGYFTSDQVQWNGDILENSFLANARLKKYDYYAIYTEKELYSFVIADLGLASFSFVSIFDGKQYQADDQIFTPFSDVKLSNSTTVGDSQINGSWSMHFQNKSPTKKHIKVDCQALGGFKADLTLVSDKDQETIGVIVPFTEHGSQFFHSVKKYNYEVDGVIEIAGKKVKITKALGVLDWVRASFPYKTTWIWGAGAGFQDGKKISVNVGEFMGGNQFANATDDALFIDDKMIKLNTVQVDFDQTDLTKTITLKTLEGPKAQAKISFKPKGQKTDSLNLWLIKQNLTKVYGQFEGTVKDGDKEYKFSVPGQIEFQLARWQFFKI